MRRTFALRRFAALALVAATVSACGDDPIGPRTATDVTFDPSLGVDLAAMTEIDNGVYIQTLQEGDGLTIFDGSVTVDYTLWLWNGDQVDAGTGFTFELDADQVIAGFNAGVKGMKVAETRLIVIPSEQGYGNQDRDRIPANSVLVFRVTLTAAEQGAGGPS